MTFSNCKFVRRTCAKRESKNACISRLLESIMLIMDIWAKKFRFREHPNQYHSDLDDSRMTAILSSFKEGLYPCQGHDKRETIPISNSLKPGKCWLWDTKSIIMQVLLSHNRTFAWPWDCFIFDKEALHFLQPTSCITMVVLHTRHRALH